MPVVLLERLTFLNLKLYSLVSSVLLTCAIYYTHVTVMSFNDERHKQYNDNDEISEENFNTTSTLTFKEYYREFVTALLQEPWCIMVRHCTSISMKFLVRMSCDTELINLLLWAAVAKYTIELIWYLLVLARMRLSY